jgi:hypothetical protein
VKKDADFDSPPTSCCSPQQQRGDHPSSETLRSYQLYRSCPAVSWAYTAPVSRQLYYVFGFGRSEGLSGTKSWRRHFEEVVGHFEMCEQYSCRYYGVVGESLLPLIRSANNSYSVAALTLMPSFRRPKGLDTLASAFSEVEDRLGSPGGRGPLQKVVGGSA